MSYTKRQPARPRSTKYSPRTQENCPLGGPGAGYNAIDFARPAAGRMTMPDDLPGTLACASGPLAERMPQGSEAAMVSDRCQETAESGSSPVLGRC